MPPTTITLLTDLAKTALSAFGGREQHHQMTGSGTFEIDLANGNAQTVVLTGPSSLVFAGAEPGVSCSFVLRVRQGTADNTLSWPNSVRWPEGTEPVVSADQGSLDKFVFETVDGGATWEGNVAGQGYELP